MRKYIALALAVGAVAGCMLPVHARTDTRAVAYQVEPVSAAEGKALVVAHSALGSESDLWRSYEQRDFFALRSRLPRTSVTDTDRIRLVRAATQAAFGDHEAAKCTLRQLLARTPDRATEDLARRLLMREERAGYHYRAALAAIEPLLPADSAKDGPQEADLRNAALLLKALVNVAPQRVERDTDPIAVSRDLEGRFSVRINGHRVKLGFDTGANFSFLAASTARELGLEVRPVGVAVATSTGDAVGAEIAVGDITLGSSRIRNVVFLVYPDAGLTMPDGFFMPGLLGFPVMAALGAIRYSRDGSTRVGVAALTRPPNLALDGNDVLARVGFRNEDLLCRLDTGADTTVFYEPFYRRYSELFTDPSRSHELKLGGVSGAREIPAYRLASIDFQLAGRPVHLADTDVIQKSIARNPEDNYLACNLGLDTLRTFGSYTINLKSLHIDLQDGLDGQSSAAKTRHRDRAPD